MKSPFVHELEINKPVITSFLVHSKEIREKKTGEPYLSLLLGDKTGKIDAKMWDNVADVLDAFDRDDFVKVKAMVQLHQNRPQLVLHKIRLLEANEIDFADYFPATSRNVDEMWRELRRYVAKVRSPHVRALLDSFLDDEAIARGYRQAPAAKSIHHAYLGGLLEHVLSLCFLCEMTSAHYSYVDFDLMIAGAVLHDIGKIHELTYDRGFSYSTEGQLLGHMMIALRMIGDKVRTLPDFPPNLRTLIEHLIISHHGKLEFGSAKLPQFPEALLLHYLDDMDSKMECMRSLIENDRQTDGCFTAYNASLERTVLKKAKFLEDRETPSETPAEAKAPEPPAAPPPAAPPPAAPPPDAPQAPKPSSPFGEKLQLALIKD